MSNYSPIVLFVYNRPDETKKSLDALRLNVLAKESELYIFSDAPSKVTVTENVDKVRSLIRNLDGFKDIYIIESDINKGLANSVIDGVTEVINKHEKVIVLEDDLVTSPNFLSFMNQALDCYESNKKIISISGYTHRIQLPENYEYDAYFTHRMSSYGWGTWLDRWETIDWELKDYNSFKCNVRENLNFMKGGEDLPRMLAAYKKGKINSWAIRFCYHQYKTETYTVYPTISKLDNIGFNSMATNTVQRKAFDIIDFFPSSDTRFILPEEIKIDKLINRSFLKKYKTINRILAKYFLNR